MGPTKQYPINAFGMSDGLPYVGVELAQSSYKNHILVSGYDSMSMIFFLFSKSLT